MLTNRLFKSSRFWNAVIASIFVVLGYYITNSELIAGGILSLFGIKQVADGAEKYVKAKKGIRFNKESGVEEYIPSTPGESGKSCVCDQTPCVCKTAS